MAFGTGYAGRWAMGQQPVSWAYMTRYVKAFRALLGGETVDWEGSPMRMLHTPEYPRGAPDTIPVYIAAIGPTRRRGSGQGAARRAGTVAVVLKTPEAERHLAVHHGHLLRLNEADTAACVVYKPYSEKLSRRTVEA